MQHHLAITKKVSQTFWRCIEAKTDSHFTAVVSLGLGGKFKVKAVVQKPKFFRVLGLRRSEARRRHWIGELVKNVAESVIYGKKAAKVRLHWAKDEAIEYCAMQSRRFFISARHTAMAPWRAVSKQNRFRVQIGQDGPNASRCPQVAPSNRSYVDSSCLKSS